VDQHCEVPKWCFGGPYLRACLRVIGASVTVMLLYATCKIYEP
jgi:hypothetical protein